MPWVEKDIRAILLLYQRCQTHKTLPEPGGVFNQREEIMAAFDILDNEIAAWRQKEFEDQRSRVEQRQLLGKTLKAYG